MENNLTKIKKLYISLAIISFFEITLLSCAITMWVLFWPHFIDVINNSYNFTSNGLILRNGTFIITASLAILSLPILIISIHIHKERNKLYEQEQMNSYFEDIKLKRQQQKSNTTFGINLNSELVQTIVSKDKLENSDSFFPPFIKPKPAVNKNVNNNINAQEVYSTNMASSSKLDPEPFSNFANTENDGFIPQINTSFVNSQPRFAKPFDYGNSPSKVNVTNDHYSPQEFAYQAPERPISKPPYFANSTLNTRPLNNVPSNYQPQFRQGNQANMQNTYNSSNVEYTNRFNDFSSIKQPDKSYKNYSASNHTIMDDILVKNRQPSYSASNFNNHSVPQPLNSSGWKDSAGKHLSPSTFFNDSSKTTASYQQTKTNKSQLSETNNLQNSNWPN